MLWIFSTSFTAQRLSNAQGFFSLFRILNQPNEAVHLQTKRAFGLSGIFLRLCSGRFWDYVEYGVRDVDLPLGLLSAFVDSPLERPGNSESLDIIPHLRHEEGVNLDKYTSYKVKSNWITRTERTHGNTDQVRYTCVIDIMKILCYNLLLDGQPKKLIIRKLNTDFDAFCGSGL